MISETKILGLLTFIKKQLFLPEIVILIKVSLKILTERKHGLKQLATFYKGLSANY